MRWSLALSALAALSPFAAAERMLVSKSLSTCQQDSSFSASLFHVVYTPHNNSASINMAITSSVQGYVVFDLAITAYGYQVIRQTINPCETELQGLCPMNTGNQDIEFPIPIPEDAASEIPGIAYTVPDLDAKVKVFVNMTKTDESVACIEAEFSNTKTVDLIGIKWATAVIAGLALVSSAVISGLGHTNAAAHIAANSLALFSYFQAQAMVGLTAVDMPPIAQAWTQNFQWSMGIIKAPFMQTIFTWYQRATGGTAATIFDSLRTHSVQVEKRALIGGPSAASAGLDLFSRAVAKMPRDTAAAMSSHLSRRGNIELGTGNYLVYGIQRVAFKMGIETTNLFATCLTFFMLFAFFTILAVLAFKGLCELLTKKKVMKTDQFLDFRNGWVTILKGILFRVTLLGYPSMTILSLWEFSQVDSPALVVLAVFFFFGMTITLGWGAFKVISIARRSVAMHRNPAYILFSDPQALNKWGFLYIQYRASAYYFIVPTMAYILVKSMFVALAQKSGITQAIALIIIEVAALIGASVLRPWMDKPTNSFNIAILAVNFLNGIFLLIFTNVFGAPGLVVGVVGVVLFILNAAFSLALLLLVIISTSLVFFRKDPDTRYHYMADDRTSFMKSQTQLNATTELDALAATARGDKAGYKSQLDLDDDNDSVSSDSMRRRTDPSYMELSAGHPVAGGGGAGARPRSPVNPSMPLFPSNRPESPFRSNSPSPYGQSSSGGGAQAASFRAQNNSSPWQRGAGYDH
ncbi:Transient receptor potential (TRP) ion channel [Geosmithia morbida]|uniref:Transient receptor potential (TRP) ion channel n=1 Tax=Geosmithia morbida TaxID=1094350 RepID=A0A9P5D470_9HYPO|nr:Transient receptor potential (TRP) ion channel [Geosmithia morbida]KAF4125732.1 Transient receptor potential (TRP) ion channel [Geosmithia morbida]